MVMATMDVDSYGGFLVHGHYDCGLGLPVET